MLVVSSFSVPDADAEAFLHRSREALAALGDRPGFRAGRVGRAADDPTAWVLVTEWDGVGAYRRALSAADVKLRANPLLATAHDQPSAFEVMLHQDGGGAVGSTPSGRAPDAATAAPGRFVRRPDDPRPAAPPD